MNKDTASPLTPQPSASSSIWISPAELAKLPLAGRAWDRVKSAADGDLGTPNIAAQNSKHDINTRS